MAIATSRSPAAGNRVSTIPVLCLHGAAKPFLLIANSHSAGWFTNADLSGLPVCLSAIGVNPSGVPLGVPLRISAYPPFHLIGSNAVAETLTSLMRDLHFVVLANASN